MRVAAVLTTAMENWQLRRAERRRINDGDLMDLIQERWMLPDGSRDAGNRDLSAPLLDTESATRPVAKPSSKR